MDYTAHYNTFWGVSSISFVYNLFDGCAAVPRGVEYPQTERIDTMDGTIRSNIKPGMTVAVVQKQDQRTGRLTEGVVERLLTN